ncbi:MAG: benzaldehyde lyase [Alphaproteobacteria bacterium HGW-Alphaproteobacteria-12]|nr:MAG: benzaldehyde lyase [Alphaproteobacteria bacterium HGW-Alphaproteobacteria-12]
MTLSASQTGGDLLAATLHAAGVSRVFGLHGGHLEAFLKGCVDRDIALLDFRHEAAAGHAADAYARATGRLGVCVVTAGPGVTNAMSAIANAHLDASPTLFIIGAPPLREAETNPLQGGFDQIAMVQPVTKWAHRITNVERIPDLAAMAIRQAMTGRCGPVVLEVPIDVLHAHADPAQVTEPASGWAAPRPAPLPSEAARIVKLLSQAKRPAIIAGGAARHAQCGPALTAFAEASGIPVFGNTTALGLLASDHPLSGGSPSNLAILKLTGQEVPDVILLLGARMGLLLGGRGDVIVPKDCQLVQIYPDAAEIGRIRDIDIAVAADCGAALEALLSAGKDVAWPSREAWAQTAVSMQTLMAGLYPETEGPGGIHPYHAARAVMTVAGSGAAYAFDGGEAAGWAGDNVRVDGPGRVLGHGYLGCLGIGPGFAIGLQSAYPERRVIQMTGDGAMGFHIQEFDTMVRHQLPIVTVVLNNRVWGMSIHGQQIMYGPNYSAMTKLGDTSYASVAGAFGCYSERVERYDEIAPALTRALASGQPACIEIMVDADVVHPSTTAMLGKPADGSDDIIIPYYENIAPAP